MANKKQTPKRTIQIETRKRAGKDRQLVNAKARLFALSKGGSRLSPMSVPSVAVIENRATAIPCPQCDGRLTIDEHIVDRETEDLLRLILMHCTECLVRQRLWFRIEVPRAN